MGENGANIFGLGFRNPKFKRREEEEEEEEGAIS